MEWKRRSPDLEQQSAKAQRQPVVVGGVLESSLLGFVLFLNRFRGSEYEVKSIYAAAWDDIPISTFQDIDDRFDEDFMADYIDGGTFLNRKFDLLLCDSNIAAFHLFSHQLWYAVQTFQ